MGAPPEGVSLDRWELARIRAAQSDVWAKWKSPVGWNGPKARKLREAFRLGYCDTSGNVAAWLKERGMEAAINELSRWQHKREGYEVEVGPRPTTEDGRILMKDKNDARWSDAVIYRRTEEGEEGNVYVREREDFLAKFEELEGPAPVVEEVTPDEAETAPEDVESDADSGASADE